jgi:GNAT superfamily N-acetyltransferase
MSFTRPLAAGVGVAAVRVAADADVPAVVRIDRLAFPADSPDQQRAAPGELEAGVAAGDVYVLEDAGAEVVAYVHIDRSAPDLVYVSGIAVRPDLQGRGLGSGMIDHFLASVGPGRHHVPVVTITSPRNVVMLRTLFRRHFVARWLLRDYFGPGKHRFCCQLHPTGRWDPAVPSRWVPVADQATLFALVEGGMAVRSLRSAGGTPEYELVPPAPDFLPCRVPG